tara:strand:+ start:4007 stop:4594 length:588 start_codon:yes stop_codon:yes gene_type:complete
MKLMKKIILASSSKHRKKLLNQLKIKFSTISPDIDESRKRNESVDEYVKRLSIEKARKVAGENKNAIIIGSDEVAVVDKKILGKPLKKINAVKQLKMISNKSVIFKTGLCVIDTQTNKQYSSVTNYKIKVKKLNNNEILSYINKEDILNCAGSIKLEGLAIAIVEKAYGYDPTSVIGLPLIKLRVYLSKMGVEIL